MAVLEEPLIPVELLIEPLEWMETCQDIVVEAVMIK